MLVAVRTGLENMMNANSRGINILGIIFCHANQANLYHKCLNMFHILNMYFNI